MEDSIQRGAEALYEAGYVWPEKLRMKLTSIVIDSMTLPWLPKAKVLD